jgi:hypothetical protein
MRRTLIAGIVVSLSLAAALEVGAEPRPPVLPDIEVVTRRWSAVPPQVFPVSVTVARDVATASGEKLPKGAIITITGQDGFRLNAVTTDDPATRLRVTLEDTDFMARVTTLYRAWAIQQKDSLGNAFAVDAFGKYLEQQRTKKQFGETGKPLRNADGSYPILLESMLQGQVTEITPDVIFKWGEAEERIANGAKYWVIRVDYRLKTVFSKAEASAEAWIKDARVVKWVYTGSGEVVP